MNEDVIQGAMQNGLGSMKQAAGQALDDGELEMKGKAQKLAGKAQKTYGQVKENTIGRVQQFGGYVRERPYAALALAVTAGIVLGRLISIDRPRVVYLRDR